jgi:hypothetical protein
MLESVRRIVRRSGQGDSLIPGAIRIIPNSTLHVKSSPVKDATTTEGLSIMSGHYQKRNDQGIWHKRHLCIVPHSFLYYFEEDKETEVPHGVVDLEYYTEVTVEEDCILKLSVPAYVNSTIKPFYFKFDDLQILNDWVASIKRDRFLAVREERDAYQELQEQFSKQINDNAGMVEALASEKDAMLAELAATRKNSEDSIISIDRLVSLLDLTTTSSSVIASGEAVELAIRELKASHTRDIELITTDKDKSITELQNNVEELDEKILRLERLLAMETSSLQTAEANYLRDKEDGEIRHKDSLSRIEQLGNNIQDALSGKEAADEKSARLQSEKKLLIKEVKSLRKKEEEHIELVSAMKLLKEENENMALTIASLQQQLQKQSLESPKSTNSEVESLEGSIGKSSLAVSIDGSETSTSTADNLNKGEGGASQVDQIIDSDRSSQNSSPTSSSPQSTLQVLSRAFRSESAVNGEDLSEPSTAPSSSQQQPSAGSSSSRRPSLMQSLGSVFRRPNQQQLQEEEDDSPSSSSSEFKMRCYRCQGTVEGPKYSTCKCPVPAMCPEDVKPSRIDSIFSLVQNRSSKSHTETTPALQVDESIPSPSTK